MAKKRSLRQSNE